MKKRIISAVAIICLIAIFATLSGCQKKVDITVLTGEINAGATAEINVLHTSDTHLTYYDNTDTAEVRRYGKSRYRHFGQNMQQTLDEIVAMAKEENRLLIHTGDLLDFETDANIQKAKEFFDESDCLYVPGNHETEADASYVEKLQAVYKRNLTFYCEEINGVCFVGLDNTNHKMTAEQLDLLKEVVETGKPIILLMHVPLYEEGLFYESIKADGSAYLMAVPEEMMTDYPEMRYEQQKADEITYTAYEYIISQPNIKAILAGHLHLSYECSVGNVKQYVVGRNTVRKITIK